MRLSRIYQAQPLVEGATLSLDPEAAHYLGNVLRLKPGEAVNLFNARDGEFRTEVIEVSRQQVVVRVNSRVENRSDPKLTIRLGLGLSRGERMDYGIQKATELGVVAITPLVTDYCEVRLDGKRLQNRLRHWQRVAISACEQCGRSTLPELHAPQPVGEWLSAHPAGLLLDQRGDAGLGDWQSDGAISLATGPEGGFSAAELSLARQQGYRIVQLGPRILRAETAPVVALSLLQYLYGDLG
jgi:16S rRNA (uracil1498-N3)-methyltransferase